MKLFLLANEKPDGGEMKDRVIRVPYGTWDYGTKRIGEGPRAVDVFFRQTLAKPGAEKIAATIAAKIARGEKGVPVYWGHPDVPDLAAKYPDKRAKGWIVQGTAADDALLLTVDWLEEKATGGFGWFSPYWGGENAMHGDGTATMTVSDIRSVALVNEPNIEDFRLANESQGEDNAAEAEKGKQMNITKEELCGLLGLPPEATDDQIRAALAEAVKAKEELATEKTKLEAANEEAKEAKGECEKAKAELANEKAAHRAILLDNAIADGRISVAGRAAWDKRLADDFKAGSVALANERPLKRESAVAGRTPPKSNDINLVALANERMSKNPGMTYTAAFAQVMKEHPEVK